MSSIANKINKFDKPHLPVPLYDLGRKTDMFNAVLSLDTHEILQCNLMYKIPFTITDDDRNSLIHILLNNPSKSSELAKLSVIKFLINNGVDPDKPNKYNQTALHLACNQQLEKIVEYLLKNYAKANYKDNSGRTPFHYLLTGSINPVPPTEIIDFIPPTNNVNFAKVELIKIIENEITELLKQIQYLPIFETIQNTIIEFIKHDVEIKKFIQEFKNAQLVDLEDNENIYYARDISENMKLFESKITQRIKSKFSVKPLKNLAVHRKEPASWMDIPSIPSESEYALIKDGNIDESIRQTIKSNYNELQTFINNFSPYEVDFIQSNYFDLHKTIYYKLYITYIINERLLYTYSFYDTNTRAYVENRAFVHSSIIPFKGPPLQFYYTEKKLPIKKHFIEQDDKLRYITAFDNASSIINFNTLKYTGGPRHIELGYNETPEFNNNNSAIKYIEFLLEKIFKFNDDVLIGFMLAPTDEYLEDILWNNYDNPNPASEILTTIHMDILKNNIDMYIYLSLNAIKYKLKKIDLNDFYNDPEYNKRSAFLIKWIKLWKEEEAFDLGAWIFNMWTDCSCRASRSNLTGFVHFKLLILINNLHNLNNTTNIKASIINSLKPHLISSYVHKLVSPAPAPASASASASDLNSLIAIILILLSNYINVYYTINTNILDVVDNINNAFSYTLDNTTYYPISNINIKYICVLLYIYFTNTNNFNEIIKSLDAKIQTYYNNYKSKSKSDKFIDILCNMILDEYHNMPIKPVKQTILDFLFLLNEFNTSKDINEFKKLSIIFFLSNIPTHFEDNTKTLLTLPSYLGYLNVMNSQTNNVYKIDQIYDNLLISHFTIAHILGLYYEGTLNESGFDSLINEFVPIYDDNKRLYKFTPGHLSKENGKWIWKHNVNQQTNLLSHSCVPLPLQYIYANINTFDSFNQQNIINNYGPNPNYDYNQYADFYNLYEKPAIIPTIFSYFIFIYKKIQYYQTQIKQSFDSIEILILNLTTGKPRNLHKAYTEYYFYIIIYSKIIKNYYKSYKELTKMPFYKDAIFTDWIKLFLQDESGERSKFKLPETSININKLATILNKINSSYYIYHYIYQSGDKIKLDAFNYYQLPDENEAIAFLYYNLDSSNIFNVYDNLRDNLPVLVATMELPNKHTGDIGLFNIYDITDYNQSYSQYINNPYLNNDINGIIRNSLIIEKKDDLPPSVYVNFDDFYKYTTIHLIIEIISKITQNDTLFKKSQDYIKKYIKLPSNMVDIYAYYLISKIIEQLIIKKYYTSIDGQIISQKNSIMRGGAISKEDAINFDFLLYNLEKQTLAITLDNSNIEFKKEVSHLYNLVIPPTTLYKDDVFILYPNDLTNINKFKIKNGITIKPNIIELLINEGGIPYNLNMENLTPIDYLLKNYQIETIKKLYEILKTNKINYNSKNSIKYIFDELNNILGKIIQPESIQLKSILLNFHQYLYEDIHQLILANTQYGNNEFIFIPLSFNISTYLILHYLKINIETEKQFIYLYTKIGDLHIYKDINAFIADEILIKKEDLLKKYEEYFNSIKDTLQNTDKNKLGQMIVRIKGEISYLKTIINYNNKICKSHNILCCNNASKLISAYQHKSLDKDNIFGKIKSLKLWEKFFDSSTINFTGNDDMKLIHIIIEQMKEMEQLKDYEKLDSAKLKILNDISNKLKKISTIAENYFTKSKFTDDNETALFIKDMLNYVAEITFKTSIILLVRRILFTYFSKIYINDNTNISDSILIILTEQNVSGETFIDILVRKTIPDLVILASNIYKNKQDELSNESKTSREILLNLFEQLKNKSITLSEEILNTFNKQVVEYLDTFIVKTIEMWHVNAENIFKYFINNYRCLTTLIYLIENK